MKTYGHKGRIHQQKNQEIAEKTNKDKKGK